MRRGAVLLASVGALAVVAALTSCGTAYPEIVWVAAGTTGEQRDVVLVRPLQGLVPVELEVVESTWVADERFPRRIGLHDDDAFQNPVESFLGLGQPAGYLRSSVTCVHGGRTLVAYGLPVGDLEFTMEDLYLSPIAEVDRERGPAMREQAEQIRAREAHGGW